MIRLFGLSVWVHFVFILVLGVLLHIYLLGDMLREPFQSGSVAEGSSTLSLGSSYQGVAPFECTPITMTYPFTQANCPQLSAQISSAKENIQTYTANGRTESLLAARQMLCAVEPYYNSLSCSTYVPPPPATPPPPERPIGRGTMISGTNTITTTIDMTSYIYPNDMIYLGADADIQGPYTVKSITSTTIITVLKNVYNTISNSPIIIYAFQGKSTSPLIQMGTDSSGSTGSSGSISSTITGSISPGQTYIVTDNSTFLPSDLATGDLVYMSTSTCNEYDIDNSDGTCSFLPCNLYETDNGDGTCTKYECEKRRNFPFSSNTNRTPVVAALTLGVNTAVGELTKYNTAISNAAKEVPDTAYFDEYGRLSTAGKTRIYYTDWKSSLTTDEKINILQEAVNTAVKAVPVPNMHTTIKPAIKTAYPSISDTDIQLIYGIIVTELIEDTTIFNVINGKFTPTVTDIDGTITLIATINTKSLIKRVIEGIIVNANSDTLTPIENDIDNGDGTCKIPTLYGECTAGDTDNGNGTCSTSLYVESSGLFNISSTLSYVKPIVSRSVNYNKKEKAISLLQNVIQATEPNNTAKDTRDTLYAVEQSVWPACSTSLTVNGMPRWYNSESSIQMTATSSTPAACLPYITAWNSYMSANKIYIEAKKKYDDATTKYNAVHTVYTKSATTNTPRMYSKNIGPFIVTIPPTTNTIQIQSMSSTDILSTGSYGGPTTFTGTLYKAAYGPQRVGCPRAGDYSNGTSCLQTPAGYYTTFNSYPLPCPAGTYCPAGSDNYTICPTGSYCPVNSSTGANGSRAAGAVAPVLCNTGTYQPNTGATSELQCVGCSQGYYCPTNGLSAQIICPVGTYCPMTYSREPSQCPAGMYCPTTGMSEAMACPSGSFCPAGSVNPTQCPVGSYCPNTHMSQPTPCPAGSYCPTAGLSQPTACPAGSYCPSSGSSTTVQCTMGNYCPTGSSSNSACPAGGYCPTPTTFTPCPERTYSPSTGQTSQATCIACDSARVCTPGSTQQGICTAGFYCTPSSYTLCPAGTYCPPGSTSPTQCTTGSYCPVGSSADTRCPAGSYCPTTTTISQCPAGSFCAEGSTAATPCTTGSYCPPGSSANTPCPAGNYCASPTTSAACPAGTYCPAGSTATTPCTTLGTYCGVQSAAAVPCPAGGFCPNPSIFNKCPIGTASAGTGKTSMSTCAACPAGSYSSVAGNTVCTPCGANSFGCGGNTAGI